MANHTKKTTNEDYSITAKELLARFSSTVFACDISGDTRYIKCDFPHCRQHAEALQGKPCWIMNTLRNVRVLENHVGKEVHQYMKEIDSRTHDQVANLHYVESQRWIETQQLPEGTRKVLAVFNLKDPQSQFGDWISLFLKAAFLAEGVKEHDCVVISQNFVSRHELMECIAKLKFLNNHSPTVEVVSVLSCHSSCQGQVFSCTPFAVSKQCEFEEFCSLHDFVMACQTVLRDALMAVHISSCFTLKLDCSHVDWPVDADWLKTKLRCTLCGSTKEVYETGSQVADLHLMLSTMLPRAAGGTCGTQLKGAANRACGEGFPDLAREMGLEVIDTDNVDQRLLREGRDDQVTPPGLVMSSVRVVLLVQDEVACTPSQGHDESSHSGPYVALVNAITANLQIRKASDVRFEYTAVQMKHDEASHIMNTLKRHISLLPCDSFKVLFIAIGPMFSRPNVELIDLVNRWNNERGGDKCYGVHFQHVTAMQAYVMKNRLKEIRETCANESDKVFSVGHLAVTGLVDNGNGNCSASLPVLLYMIHLAVGENGNRLAGKGIPSAVYSNKPVGHGMSSWTLEEVYMETCHVLSGLSRKCGLHLLSPASNPVRPTSTVSTCPSSSCATFSNSRISELDLKKRALLRLSGSEINLTQACGELSSSSMVSTIPLNTSASIREGNRCDPCHQVDGSLIVGYDKSVVTNLNKKPDFGREELDRKTVVMETSSPRGSGNSNVWSNVGKNLAAHQVSSGEASDEKVSSGATALVDYSSSSEDEVELNRDKENELDEEPAGLAFLQVESSAISTVRKDLGLSEEEEFASEVICSVESLAKKPVSGMCLEQSSLGIDAGVTDAYSTEMEGSREKLESETPSSLARLKTELASANQEEEETILSEEGRTLRLGRSGDSLGIEDVCSTCVGKEVTGVNPTVEDTTLQAWKRHSMSLTLDVGACHQESDGLVSTEKYFSNVIPLHEEPNVQCLEKEESSPSVLEDTVMSGENENVAIVEHEGDHLDKEQVGIPCVTTELSTIGACLGNERSFDGKGTSMNAEQDDSEANATSVGAVFDEEVSSPVTDGLLEDIKSSVGGGYFPVSPGSNVHDNDLTLSSMTTNNVMNSSFSRNSGDTKVPFQSWLQNFKTYCEETRRLEEEEGFQDPPSKRKNRNVQDYMSGNLESKNKCLGVTKGNGSFETQTSNKSDRISVPGMSSTRAGSSMSDLNQENTSDVEMMAVVDAYSQNEPFGHVERTRGIKCESPCDSARNSQTAAFQEINFSKIPSTSVGSPLLGIPLGNHAVGNVIRFSRLENEAESEIVKISENVQFKDTNLFENLEPGELGVERTSEGSFARKRPLLTDFSINEKSQVKKPKHESDCNSKCVGVVEKSLSSASSEWDKSEDLPLMANVDEVLVKHYVLDLSVKFSEKIMKGSIVLFLEPRNEEVTKRQFQMTLDSTLVNIESISEVDLPEDFKLKFFGQEQSGALGHESFSSHVFKGFLGNILVDRTQSPLPFKGLPYSVYGWFVRIWKPDATGSAWPRCIWIKYHTSPEGKSLTWATDQDGKPCVYSPGAYINNRSLMPCQEPPVAMSTWQASIRVPEDCVVLMSGNELVDKTTDSDGQVTFFYEMGTPLPCSTLAVAVGWWHCRQSRNADTTNGINPNVPITCRMFAPPRLIDSASDELLGYAPQFLEASCELLGPYPFKRLDMLILPKCFACMGLKSPNLVFLSQSLLSGDASMRVRLAHEISHAWFGLLVGAKDWSEEWLSEGFATFIEEKIQSRAEKWPKDKDRFYREIRQIVRHRCLMSEIKECDDSLRYLRPKVVKPSTALSTAEAIEKSGSQPNAVRPHSVVQFGQICSRKWTQVHYLKGYFLLHHLAKMVGLEQFNNFLCKYVQHYKEQLVTSEDFFEFFLHNFPVIRSETMSKFIHEWLERAGLPKSFPKRFDSPDNELVSRVEEEFQAWKKQDTLNKRNKTLKVRKRTKPRTSTLDLPEQVVLFLEKLLERDTLSHNTLRQLDRCYNFTNGNAEVRHRWCELVVKHKYNPGLLEVKRFLVEDQGMGIYLFGELIISQQPKQRALVDEVMDEISAEMDRCTYQTVKDMLEGNE